jgi:hypothetical protein
MQLTAVRVPVDDPTMDRLGQIAATQHRDLEIVASTLLTQAAALFPPTGRCVVLGPDALESLEILLQGGSIHNAQDLVQKTERLAGISFEHLRIQFTPGQLEQMQERAERQGLTVEQLVSRAVPRILEQFFNLLDLR